MGESKGEGVRVGARCFWDSNVDKMASEEFHNDSLFCIVTAYGVYVY
jgi:hypothetical protein